MSPPPPLLPASKRRRLRSRASKRRLWEGAWCQLGEEAVDGKARSSEGVLSSEGRLRSEGMLLSSEGVLLAEGPAPAEEESPKGARLLVAPDKVKEEEREDVKGAGV